MKLTPDYVRKEYVSKKSVKPTDVLTKKLIAETMKFPQGINNLVSRAGEYRARNRTGLLILTEKFYNIKYKCEENV